MIGHGGQGSAARRYAVVARQQLMAVLSCLCM